MTADSAIAFATRQHMPPWFWAVGNAMPNLTERQPHSQVSGGCETSAAEYEAQYHARKILIETSPFSGPPGNGKRYRYCRGF